MILLIMFSLIALLMFFENLSNYVSQHYLPIIFFSFGGSHQVLVSALVGSGFGFWFSYGFGLVK